MARSVFAWVSLSSFILTSSPLTQSCPYFSDPFGPDSWSPLLRGRFLPDFLTVDHPLVSEGPWGLTVESTFLILRQWEEGVWQVDSPGSFSDFLLFFKKFWLRCLACRILVSQSGMKRMLFAVEAQSLNHWTAREVPSVTIRLSSLADNMETWGYPQGSRVSDLIHSLNPSFVHAFNLPTYCFMTLCLRA